MKFLENKFNPDLNQFDLVCQDKSQKFQYQYPRHIPDFSAKFSHNSLGKKEGDIISKEEKFEAWTNFYTNKQSPLLAEALAEVHLENLRQNLERRLQVAKAKGNETLVQLLEKEFEQLV